MPRALLISLSSDWGWPGMGVRSEDPEPPGMRMGSTDSDHEDSSSSDDSSGGNSDDVLEKSINQLNLIEDMEEVIVYQCSS